jgi:hypothetical protein
MTLLLQGHSKPRQCSTLASTHSLLSQKGLAMDDTRSRGTVVVRQPPQPSGCGPEDSAFPIGHQSGASRSGCVVACLGSTPVACDPVSFNGAAIYISVTLPMPKGKGLLACASYLPGAHRDYLASRRMARILGAERSIPRMFYLLAVYPVERREHSMVQRALARRPPHTGSSPVRTSPAWHTCSRKSKERGPFIPMPEGRGPLAPDW